MKIVALVVDKYFDRAVRVFLKSASIAFVFFLTFLLSLWCVEYVEMRDHWFVTLLGWAAMVSLLATVASLLAIFVGVIIVSLTGWILTFGVVYSLLIVFELIHIWPKVHALIDNNPPSSRGDLLSIMVLLAPVALLAVVFLRTRQHEVELARLRKIPLTSKHEWSQDDG